VTIIKDLREDGKAQALYTVSLVLWAEECKQ
jgi:hypothetical protein